MLDRDFWEDFLIFLGLVGSGFIICLAIVALITPKPDYQKDRELCESKGGTWSEVVYNKDRSFCTYYRNDGR